VGEAYCADPLVVRVATPGLGRALMRQMRWTNDNLARLAIPTYVMHGADDELVPARFTRSMADLATVTRRTYPALRHEIFNEPAQLAILQELVDWLTGQLARLPAA
jgi:alpha-beta hydrolase superfamily lysophospholipase